MANWGGILLLLFGLGITAFLYFNQGILPFQTQVVVPGQFILGLENIDYSYFSMLHK